MNWKQIAEDNPKAFDLWYESLGWMPETGLSKEDFLDAVITEDLPIYGIYLRDFYDFFDEQGLHVTVSVYHPGASHCPKKVGEFELTTTVTYSAGIQVTWNPEENHSCGRGGLYQTRDEVEQWAFTQCFRLLEEKLTQSTAA